MYNCPNLLLVQWPARYNFYEQKSEKNYVQPAGPAASIAAFVLQFLEVEKRKQVHTTGFTKLGIAFFALQQLA